MAQLNEFTVYIILTHYNTYYTGITNSLLRRWKEHTNNQSSYLSRFKAKEVVYVEFHDTRKKAYKVEQRIKQMGAKKYMIIKQFETK